MQFIEGLDIGIWNFLQAIRQNRPAVDPAIAVLHWLDTPLVLLVLMAVAVMVCINRHQVRSAVFLLAAFLGGGLLAWGTLELVGRERPMAVGIRHESATSLYCFPSDQALLATVTYLALAFVLADARPARHGGIVALGVTVVFVLGVSRMFMGMCFPSDVVGAWLGGGAWVLFCRWAELRLRRAEPAEPAEPAKA
jgi:undecaprenyl-diphosphatase